MVKRSVHDPSFSEADVVRSARMVEMPSQVRLPLKVAARVVAQGIRIRLGRSMVTLTGVVLGVAFLTSILTSQVLKRSVREEDQKREEANRLYGTLLAESGPVLGRPLGLVILGPPSPAETRLLARLERDGLAEARLWHTGAPDSTLGFERVKARRVSSAGELGRAAVGILVVGSGPVPAVEWSQALSEARQRFVAFSASPPPIVTLPSGIEAVRLFRPLSAEENARNADAMQRERFRGYWIIGISLLVTIIGISNAMLMSVTERFRDIGTMKCLGAESRFIRRIFLLEATFMGGVGGVAGVLLGDLFAFSSALLAYGPKLAGHAIGEQVGGLFLSGGLSLASGAVLAVVASLYPAEFAARMLPAAALRANV